MTDVAPPRKRLRAKTRPAAAAGYASCHEAALINGASSAKRSPMAAMRSDVTRSASMAGVSCTVVPPPSASSSSNSRAPEKSSDTLNGLAGLPNNLLPGGAILRKVARPLAPGSVDRLAAKPVPAGQAGAASSGQAATETPAKPSGTIGDLTVLPGNEVLAQPVLRTPSCSSATGHTATRPVSELDRDVRLVSHGQAQAAQANDSLETRLAAGVPGVSASTAMSEDRQSGTSEGLLAFLRLSSNCSQSINIERLVYLAKVEVTIGRLPSNDVVLDSPRFPAMISRLHGRIVRVQETGKPDAWMLHDNRSMNGILVNARPVSQEGHRLQQGDIINFGRVVSPPEFEFIFEGPTSQSQPLAPVEAAFTDYTHRLAELEQQLEAERGRRNMESQQRAPARSALDIADIQSELLCSICRDWVVHASTLECAHTFCWSCIDQWLLHKKFECPECRHEITNEPVRSHVIDSIVQKTLGRSDIEEKAEYDDRVRAAQEGLEKVEQLRSDLEKAVNEAASNGKTYLQIDSDWRRKEKDAFQTGAKDFTGNTRETYCRLRGLTVQWVHSADDSQLNQALHNLGLQAFVSSTDADIRKRLLMFLRYG